MYVIVIAVLSLISCICAQEQVRITLLSIGHYESEEDGHYQCHLSDPDNTGETVTSFRAVHTRNGGDLENPDPPDAVYRVGDKFPHHRVVLRDNNDDEWFGVFGCKATRDGKLETRISSTRMRSDADFTPANELFTQTVNVGDRDVSITMYSPTGRDTSGMRWRKDNGSVISSQSGSDTFLIPGPIQLRDAGTYECQYNGERDMAKQGLNLLIVRACPANRWGPPDCAEVCDSCYNGGICDENNGTCICPPGFMGDNCNQACGGNRYGHKCEIRCSSRNNEGSCGTYLFCLVHPFGCRCNTGWKGLACDTACSHNTFGASCLQSCHCVSNHCNQYTGRCTGSDTRCKPGWTGDNCQECSGNYFGKDCSHECHCSKENCNRETGLCQPGGCLPQWADHNRPYSCQTGLGNITYTKMNPGVPVPVTCQAVEGPGGNLSSLQLVLSKDPETLEDDDITAGERSEGGSTRNFIVANVQEGDRLHCQLRNGTGKLAFLSLSVDVFDLPVLTSAPVNDYVDGSSVTISWSAWTEATHVGDPPLVGYIPYYKVTDENIWIPSEMVSQHTLMHTFTSLNPETIYSFSVSAVREGKGGEGPRSPQLSVRISCDASGVFEAYVVAVAVIVPIVMILIIIAVVFIYLRYRSKSSGKTLPKKPVEKTYENEALSDTDDYSKDQVKTESTVHQGLKAKGGIKMMAEEHATNTDDAGYEMSIPSSNRNNTQVSNFTRRSKEENVGTAESHYEDPDIFTDRRNIFLNLSKKK